MKCPRGSVVGNVWGNVRIPDKMQTKMNELEKLKQGVTHFCVSTNDVFRINGVFADEYCNGVMCPWPMSCVVDTENQTSCVCSNKCDDSYYPVCGSDNKTYDNFCQFNYVACQGNISTDYYYGVCSEGQSTGMCVRLRKEACSSNALHC